MVLLPRWLRQAARALAARPAFSATAVVVLALGIGAATTIFSVVDTLMIRPLPHRDADRIVTAWAVDARRDGLREEVSPGDFFDWRERSHAFAELAAVDPWSLDLETGGRPEVLFAARVTEGFFEAMGARPLLGRTFTAAEHVAGREKVVVLGHAVWERRFGADRGLVGRALILDGEPYTVVGVLPASFQTRLVPSVREERDVWIPLVPEGWEEHVRDTGWWNVVGRLRPGVGLAEARAELGAIAAQLAAEHPETNHGRSATLVPLRHHLVGDAKAALLVLQTAVGLLLLIACANVAGLLLARGAERRRELAIRAALGAGRQRLVRELLAEGLLLALAGAAGGALLAIWGVEAIQAAAPGSLALLDQVAVDARVLAFAGGLAALTTLLCGLIPALGLSRPDLAGPMRRGAAAAASSGPGRLRSGLVVAEVAFSVVLVVGAGLLVRSLVGLLGVDPGFRKEGVLAVQVFTWDGFDEAGRRAFVRQVVERLEALPGAGAAGAVSALPFIEANIGIQSRFRIVGRPATRPEELPGAHLTVATPGYFPAMGIPLLEGRLLAPSDREGTPPVAVVSESLARRYWPRESALGQRIVLLEEGDSHVQGDEGAGRECEIVGVVGDVLHDGLAAAPRAEVFLAHAQSPFGAMTFVARVAGDAGALLGAAREVIWDLRPEQAIYRSATMDELFAKSLAERRFNLALLGSFAGLALLLAAVGLYVVVSYAARARRREIGIRVALGAGRRRILAETMGRGLRLAALGVACGLAAALGLSRFLSALLFGIEPTDPLTFGLVVAVLGGSAVVATYLPARRAARLDPVTVLRGE